MSVKPIKPSEVKVSGFPDEVIEAFNELIQRYWDGDQAIFKQEQAVALIASKMNIANKEVFRRKLLDVERLFREAGWKVHYDKPGYNEAPYGPKFTFEAG